MTRFLSAIIVAALSGLALAGPQTPPPDFPETPPMAPPLEPPSLPSAFSQKLANGMEVVVVTSDEIPWVSASWYLLGGAKYDPPGIDGVAATTAELLRQGTEKHTGDELAELLDYHAIKLSGSAGYNTTSVYVGSLDKDVDLAVRCLAEVVRTPVFPPKEVKRHIAQTVNNLKVAERHGKYWADREFRKRIYGKHFLARKSDGTSQTLPKIQRTDLVEFHRKHYLPNSSILIFSGAIDSTKAVALAEKYFGDWDPGQMPGCDVAPIPEPSATHIYLVDRPDATESQIRIGQLGYRRTDPQYVPGQVFNQVFGGAFNSRLNATVRIKEGLTYGAHGGFSAGKEPGRLLAATSTKNETTAEAVKAVMSVIQSMPTEPPTTEELSDAQSYITGRFGLSLETPQQVAGKVFSLKYYDLPRDYYETYLKQINTLTAQDIISFAKKAVDLGRLTVVVVGKADEIKETLSEIAPVTVVKPETNASVD